MPIGPASGDDPVKPSQPRIHRREIAIGLILAASVYTICLITTLPARLVFQPPANVSVEGTVWNGKATLPGDNEANWTADLPRSLGHLSFAVDWGLAGPGNALTGRARFGFASVVADGVSGRASASLIHAFMPGWSTPCDGEARVDIRHFRWSRKAFEADGDVRSAQASCPSPQGAAKPVPPLIATLTTDQGALSARIATLEAPAAILAAATLDPAGRLVAELRPGAAAVFPDLPPDMPNSGPFRIETTIDMP